MNMEIISYSETNRFTTPKVSRGKQAIAAVKTVASPLSRTKFDFRAWFNTFVTISGHAIKSSAKYLWIVPAVIICCLIPLTVTKTISYVESFARKVTFDTSESAPVEILDSALNDFVLYAKGSFDSDGTVLDADGIAATLASVTFKQPVVFQTYKVRAGDTIDTISRKFGLSNISTLIAVNNISNVRSLRSGQKLRVPTMDGLIHTVKKGETLNGISVKYGVTVEDLLDVNDLSSEILSTGKELFIPGARLDTLSLHKAMGEVFSWPITAKWRLSSKFGPRINPVSGVNSNHTGIDMACPTGTPIKVAMAGKVAYTGVSNVFGYYVIVTHYDGYQTLYAHMSKILTKKGQIVEQGTKIGLVGSTGQSTGPHLHFTVYKNGKLVDPLTLLK